MNMTRRAALVAAATVAGFGLHANAVGADLKVGLSVSLSGPNSSLGIPVRQGHAGRAGLQAARSTAARSSSSCSTTAPIPTNAGRNARKLVEEEKVDVLMGSSGVPATIAIAQVGHESKTPMIGLSPISLTPAENDWTVTVAQPTQLMIDAVVERMKRNSVKTVGYIGFSDAWGDLVYNALMKAAPSRPASRCVTNERYARADAVGHRPGAEDRRGAGPTR